MSNSETFIYGIILVAIILVTGLAIVDAFVDSTHNIGSNVLAAGGLIAIAIMMHGNIMSASSSDKDENEDREQTEA